MWHGSERLNDVESRTNCVIKAGDTGKLRISQVDRALVTKLRSPGRSLLLTVCSSTREDGLLYGVEFRAERFHRDFVRHVQSKPVICQVITGKKLEMDAKHLNILGVVNMF